MLSAADHLLSLAASGLLAWTIANLLAAVGLAVLIARQIRDKTRQGPPGLEAGPAAQAAPANPEAHREAETRVYHLLNREQAQVRRLENLRTASANITIEVSLNGVLKSIAGNAAVLLDAETCEVSLLEPELEEVFPSRDDGEAAHPSMIEGSQIRQNLLNTGRGVLISPSAPLQSVDQAPAPRSLIAAPLAIRKQILGILAVSETRREAPFNADDLQLLELFAQQSAIAIQNAQFFEEINRLAVTDGLTGIFNHRQVTSLTLQELERARRYSMPFSLCMFDIDHFKHINDQYGHRTGDKVLRWLAQLCKNALRFNDIVGRYGGEEFLILLPNTPFSAAMQCAERLRQQVDQAAFQNEQSQIKITISMGVATWSATTETVESLLEAADKALYHSKQTGRNRVTGLDTEAGHFVLYPAVSL